MSAKKHMYVSSALKFKINSKSETILLGKGNLKAWLLASLPSICRYRKWLTLSRTHPTQNMRKWEPTALLIACLQQWGWWLMTDNCSRDTTRHFSDTRTNGWEFHISWGLINTGWCFVITLHSNISNGSRYITTMITSNFESSQPWPSLYSYRVTHNYFPIRCSNLNELIGQLLWDTL